MSRRIHYALFSATALLALAVGVGIVWNNSRHQRPAPLQSAVANPQSAIGASSGPVHPVVRSILANDNGAQRSLDALEKLPRELSREDALRLLKFATSPRPANVPEAFWPVMVNDTFNVLRRQDQAIDPVSSLDTMYRDPATPYILRDYAIQHIGGWLADATHVKNREEARAGLDVLWHAAASSEPLAGTAFCALLDLLDNRPGFVDAARLDTLAAAAAGNPATGKFARITALQIAARRGLASALPAARATAADATADPSVRLSAIACLGQLGNKDDIDWLRSLAASPEACRYQDAINAASRKLQASRH